MIYSIQRDVCMSYADVMPVYKGDLSNLRFGMCEGSEPSLQGISRDG